MSCYVPSEGAYLMTAGASPIHRYRPLREIALDVLMDWKNVSYAAVPYLHAMSELDSVGDMYGQDPARHVVNYFLGNATSWHGSVARRIKAELRAMVNGTAVEVIR